MPLATAKAVYIYHFRISLMEFWADLAHDLMRLKPTKLPYFQNGLRAMTLIQSALDISGKDLETINSRALSTTLLWLYIRHTRRN